MSSAISWVLRKRSPPLSSDHRPWTMDDHMVNGPWCIVRKEILSMSKIQIYDTTLRDGTQSEGFTLSGNDKIRIAQKLDELGVAFIEGGWPGSNPKDVEFFERARDMHWTNALIAAFGSTCRVKGGPEDDSNIRALI